MTRLTLAADWRARARTLVLVCAEAGITSVELAEDSGGWRATGWWHNATLTATHPDPFTALEALASARPHPLCPNCRRPARFTGPRRSRSCRWKAVDGAWHAACAPSPPGDR